MRGEKCGRTIFDVVDEDEHGKLILNFALVLVYVGHDFFERGDRFGE